MDNLLPCPFCGGEAYVLERPHVIDMRYSVGCNDDECRGFIGLSWLYKTEAEAIEEWNTRVYYEATTEAVTPEMLSAAGYVKERTCFADEVTHRDCKYSVNRGWRERTCEEYGSVRVWQSCNVWSHELSCGHEVDTLEREPPNYCPNCGAKVIGGNDD